MQREALLLAAYAIANSTQHYSHLLKYLQSTPHSWRRESLHAFGITACGVVEVAVGRSLFTITQCRLFRIFQIGRAGHSTPRITPGDRNALIVIGDADFTGLALGVSLAFGQCLLLGAFFGFLTGRNAHCSICSSDCAPTRFPLRLWLLRRPRPRVWPHRRTAFPAGATA